MWKNPFADSKGKDFSFKPNKKRQRRDKKEMLTDPAQPAMHAHLATSKAGAGVSTHLWLISHTFLRDALFTPLENIWDPPPHLALSHMFHKNLLSSWFMLLASPSHYHISEGGDPSNSVQHLKHGTCSGLNADRTQAHTPEVSVFIWDPRCRKRQGCDAEVTLEHSLVQPLGLLTGCSHSYTCCVLLKVPPKPPSRYHMQKANSWSHSITGFPALK